MTRDQVEVKVSKDVECVEGLVVAEKEYGEGDALVRGFGCQVILYSNHDQSTDGLGVERGNHGPACGRAMKRDGPVLQPRSTPDTQEVRSRPLKGVSLPTHSLAVS